MTWLTRQLGGASSAKRSSHPRSIIGLADGLATAHEAGILHRDVKPQSEAGGLRPGKLRESPSLLANAPTETRTRLDVIVGTVAYMSPEQASGQPLTGRDNPGDSALT